METKWYPEIQQHWRRQDISIPCILVGLKAELRMLGVNEVTRDEVCIKTLHVFELYFIIHYRLKSLLREFMLVDILKVVLKPKLV